MLLPGKMKLPLRVLLTRVSEGGDQMSAPHFDVETQSAASISNVGGNQNVYLDGERSRAAALGRAGAAIGLAALFSGLGLLVATIVRTTQGVLGDVHHLSGPYTQYVSDLWLPAVLLLAIGVVLVRFGRLFANR